MKHLLKILPEYFEEVVKGTKPFEVRKNDRGFEIGDILILAEFCPKIKTFTGNVVEKQVTYILEGGSFGIEKGFVVMGLESISVLVPDIMSDIISDEERKDLIEWAFYLNIQNLSLKDTENQAFREGIAVGIDELTEHLNGRQTRDIQKE